MTQAREALAALWSLGGGPPEALERVTLSGVEPGAAVVVPGRHAAQVSIAAAGLAAAELWRLRSGRAQRVSVDMRAAALEFRSERYLRSRGGSRRRCGTRSRACTGPATAAPCACTRTSRTTARARRRAARLRRHARVGAGGARGWKGEDFETAANGAGGVVVDAAQRRGVERAPAGARARGAAALRRSSGSATRPAAARPRGAPARGRARARPDPRSSRGRCAGARSPRTAPTCCASRRRRCRSSSGS